MLNPLRVRTSRHCLKNINISTGEIDCFASFFKPCEFTHGVFPFTLNRKEGFLAPVYPSEVCAIRIWSSGFPPRPVQALWNLWSISLKDRKCGVCTYLSRNRWLLFMSLRTLFSPIRLFPRQINISISWKKASLCENEKIETHSTIMPVENATGAIYHTKKNIPGS